jgi:hypothetical protein
MVQKELRKLSQWFWKGFLKCYDEGGENGITSKRFFEVEVFLSSQNIDFPFYLKRLLELFLCSIYWALGHFGDIWGENYFFENFFSNGFNILAVGAYSGTELCTPRWLNHDYGDEGVMDILIVDAYLGLEVCTPIFLGESSN